MHYGRLKHQEVFDRLGEDYKNQLLVANSINEIVWRVDSDYEELTKRIQLLEERCQELMDQLKD